MHWKRLYVAGCCGRLFPDCWSSHLGRTTFTHTWIASTSLSERECTLYYVFVGQHHYPYITIMKYLNLIMLSAFRYTLRYTITHTLRVGMENIIGKLPISAVHMRVLRVLWNMLLHIHISKNHWMCVRLSASLMPIVQFEFSCVPDGHNLQQKVSSTNCTLNCTNKFDALKNADKIDTRWWYGRNGMCVRTEKIQVFVAVT